MSIILSLFCYILKGTSLVCGVLIEDTTWTFPTLDYQIHQDIIGGHSVNFKQVVVKC